MEHASTVYKIFLVWRNKKIISVFVYIVTKGMWFNQRLFRCPVFKKVYIEMWVVFRYLDGVL